MNKKEEWSLLVAVISRLDSKAVSYLSNLPKANNKRKAKLGFITASYLELSFIWTFTKQGYDYWFNLNKESRPFLELCHDLYYIDQEAYFKLKDLVMNHHDLSFSKNTTSLQSVFVWSSTPERTDYWASINQKLMRA